MKKSELRQQIRNMIKEDFTTDLPTAVVPADVKAKLALAIERIKAAKLNYNQKLQIVGQVFDSLGIDKTELNKISTKLRAALPQEPGIATESKKPVVEAASKKKPKPATTKKPAPKKGK